MRRFFLVMIGLALIAVCVAWFLGPLQDLVMGSSNDVTTFGTESNELRTERSRRPRRQVGGIDINTILNAANALIGFIGLFLTIRAGRAKPDASA